MTSYIEDKSHLNRNNNLQFTNKDDSNWGKGKEVQVLEGQEFDRT